MVRIRVTHPAASHTASRSPSITWARTFLNLSSCDRSISRRDLACPSPGWMCSRSGWQTNPNCAHPWYPSLQMHRTFTLLAHFISLCLSFASHLLASNAIRRIQSCPRLVCTCFISLLFHPLFISLCIARNDQSRPSVHFLFILFVWAQLCFVFLIIPLRLLWLSGSRIFTCLPLSSRGKTQRVCGITKRGSEMMSVDR